MGFNSKEVGQIDGWIQCCACSENYFTSQTSRYPSTFYKAIAMATDELVGKLVFQSRSILEKLCYAKTDIIASDRTKDRVNYVLFGGKLNIKGRVIRGGIKVAADPSKYYTETTVGIHKANRYSGKLRRRYILLSYLLGVFNKYVYKQNPIKGKSIDIYGNEINLGGIDWNDIAIPSSFRENIEQNLLWPVFYPHVLKDAGLRLSRGVLLEGERGMGKTLVSKIIAEQIRGKGTFIKLRPSDVEKLGWDYVFQVARILEPSILYLEDIDTFSSDKFSVSTFLTDMFDYLEGSTERGNVGLLVTTNMPNSIDMRFKNRPGRIDRRLVFDPHNKQHFDINWQKEVLGIYLNGHKTSTTIDEVIGLTKDDTLTAAHLRELVYSARLRALTRLGIQNSNISNSELELRLEDFKAAREDMASVIEK